MKQIDIAGLAELAAAAQSSLRRRANRNLHDTLDAPVQRLAIAMEPDTLVLPHRHPQTWELLLPLHGRFTVLYFDAQGIVTDRAVLGESARVVENPAGQWHAVLSMDAGGVIFEVKQGAYAPVGPADQAPWGQPSTPADTEALLSWYATARIGDRFPAY